MRRGRKSKNSEMAGTKAVANTILGGYNLKRRGDINTKIGLKFIYDTIFSPMK